MHSATVRKIIRAYDDPIVRAYCWARFGTLRRARPAGGRLLVKDVDTRPAPKRWFTWLLDKAMAPAVPVHYWSADALAGALEGAGFVVRRHLMVDWLPYPHVLYVCEARG